jgi:hypothetical protein
MQVTASSRRYSHPGRSRQDRVLPTAPVTGEEYSADGAGEDQG